MRDILKFSDPDISSERGTGAWYEISGQYDIPTLPGTSDFYNHPMGVAVVADSEEACDRALRAIEIEWEERPFILDIEESVRPDAVNIMTGANRFHEKARAPNTVVADEEAFGNVEKGFAEADRIIKYKFRREFNSTAGVEPAVCVARWRGDFLDLWVHHQDIPHWFLVDKFAEKDETYPALAEWSKTTATMPYQGSTFGGLSWLAYSMCFTRLAVILARRADGRPVKLLYDESNHYTMGDDAGAFTCKIGVKKDGEITACHWHVAGPRNAVVEKTRECTRIPNVLGTYEWGLVNRGHQICIRHGAHACVPHNVMFDKVAAELGLDPVDVALRNDGCRGHDWEWVTRYQKENGFPERWSLKEVVEKGKAAMDWDRKWHPPGVKRLANGKMHGLGFMYINEWAWQAPWPASSFGCIMLRNGIAAIVGVRSDIGSDTESGARHIVASEIGLKYEDTVIHERRSDNSSFYMWQPGGSFSTPFINTQLILAARDLKKKILEYAVKPTPAYNSSHFLKAAGPPAFPDRKPADLDIRDGYVFEKANPKNRKGVRKVADIFWDVDPAIAHPDVGTFDDLTVDGKPDSTLYVMDRQAHFVEVEVDTETGMVDFRNIVCVNDVGHLFNPQGAVAQQYGGILMGLGRNGTEAHVWRPKTGVALNFDMINYHIGTMNDSPPPPCLANESHLGYAAFGAYGIGENVGAAMSGIVVSAIYNATGKWVLNHPTTPDRVLKAL